MSTYQELKGLKVKYLSADTSGDRAKEGELFYNSTSGNLKAFVASSAWHSEAPIISGRTVAQGATGTATAGLICFGNPGDAPYTLNETEEYNGSSWAIGGDTTHAAANATAAGTQTAAIAMGISDSPTTVTIKYDGTSWTDSGHAFPSTGSAGVGSGTQTATYILDKVVEQILMSMMDRLGHQVGLWQLVGLERAQVGDPKHLL